MVDISLSGISSGNWNIADEGFSPQVGEKLLLNLDLLEKHTELVERRSGNFALSLTADVGVASLKDLLEHLSMIELTVSSFTDGRVFTQARELRDLGFKGEIKVRGPVMPEQASFFARVGVDTLVVEEDAERVKAYEANLKRFNLYYQTSADGVVPVQHLRHRSAEQVKSERKAS